MDTAAPVTVPVAAPALISVIADAPPPPPPEHPESQITCDGAVLPVTFTSSPLWFASEDVTVAVVAGVVPLFTPVTEVVCADAARTSEKNSMIPNAIRVHARIFLAPRVFSQS